jgi:predicted amidohydrolase
MTFDVMEMKIGIAQFGSVHLELRQSLEKMETIVAQATKKGVQLLVFGEAWLSGYPAWIRSNGCCVEEAV